MPGARREGKTQGDEAGTAERLIDKRWARLVGVFTIVGALAGVAALVIPSHGNSNAGTHIKQESSAVNSGSNSGNVCSGNANCTVVQRGESGPRAQIVALTGAWSEQGFIDAIMTPGDTNIVSLYLKSGLNAATLHSDASAILYGFQSNLSNDPVALLKTFQANGFQLNESLTDGRILQSLTSGAFPLPFHTNLTPKGYTGGYEDGVFTGPLMLWVVQKALWAGPTDQDNETLKYLIAHGADCSVTLSFLDFNRSTLASTSPFQQLYPVIKACAT